MTAVKNRFSKHASIKCYRALIISAWIFLSHSALAENWAHWRGPDGNGQSPTATPPTQFSSSDNVKWKTRVPGRSSGSPVVWEDRVFIVTAVPADGDGQNADNAEPASGRGRGRRRSTTLRELQFKVLCFDRSNGKVIWEKIAVQATPHQDTHSTNGFASASPCTDGKRVYAHFGSRGLYCYDMEGDLIWKKDDFGKMETRNSFGEGSSPTIAGDKILVPWDHEGDSFLYALDKRSGETVWKTARDEPSCWATPLVVDLDDRQQVIMNGQNSARSYDLETGEEIWRCGGQTQRPVASPVASDGVVYIGSGFRGSFLGAFRLDGSSDIDGTKSVLWTINRDTPDIASLLLSSDRLYYFKEKTGMLTCVDAKTGKPHYSSKRLPGISRTYASPIAAGGHVYLTGRSGTIVVIKDQPDFEIVATNSMNETVDATPAPVDNELIIRGEEHLFCIAK